MVHPIWQWGDAAFGDVYDLFDECRLHEIPVLLSRTEQGVELAASLESRVAGLREQGLTDRRICDALKSDGTARDIFEALERVSVDPPEEAEQVLELVRNDRVAHLRQQKDTKMAATEKAPKAPKEVKPKDDSIAGHPPSTRIEFGTAPDTKKKVAAVKEVKDKDGKVTKAGVAASEEVIPGKKYNGTDNNPKSRGAGERFALYKNNMTLKAAVEAGARPADIQWDLSKGFIVVKA
jgi:hypothetical protein